MYRLLSLLYLMSALNLAACAPGGANIERVVSENGDPGVINHRLTASTNCAEVGDEVVITAKITNLWRTALTVTSSPPFDIIIRPYRYGGNAQPVQRWSDTDQYPRDLNPELVPGETRMYQWRWIADAAYSKSELRDSGITVQMPLPIRHVGTGERETPISDLPIGGKFHPGIGAWGMFCADLR